MRFCAYPRPCVGGVPPLATHIPSYPHVADSPFSYRHVPNVVHRLPSHALELLSLVLIVCLSSCSYFAAVSISAVAPLCLLVDTCTYLAVAASTPAYIIWSAAYFILP